MSRSELISQQLARLNGMLAALHEQPFYAQRLVGAPRRLDSIEQMDQLPLLTKQDLMGDTPGAPGKIFHLPRHAYSRWHQTSGSRGWPMPVLDTAEDWQWWIRCWQYVLDSAEVTGRDTAMMAFSFGPFIGFWTAFDALVGRGVLVVPGGGLSSAARLQLMQESGCSLLFCTPSYALRLANLASENGLDLVKGPVEKIVVAGEPGGSVPSIRAAIETLWGAKVIDHAGASEIGAWGFAVPDGSGLQVIESEFIAEFLVQDSESGVSRRANVGETCELILTNLGRHGGPLLRYRTGDLVRPVWDHSERFPFVKLEGGVLGRVDDMLVIRGVNVFPGSLEAVIREIEASAEYRILISQHANLDQLEIQLEASPEVCRILSERLRERLLLRVVVFPVAVGTLSPTNGKASRVIDHRNPKGESSRTIGKLA